MLLFLFVYLCYLSIYCSVLHKYLPVSFQISLDTEMETQKPKLKMMPEFMFQLLLQMFLLSFNIRSILFAIHLNSSIDILLTSANILSFERVVQHLDYLKCGKQAYPL